MARRVARVALCSAVSLCAALPRLAAAAASEPVASSSLLRCLEPIARHFHVRIVDSTHSAAAIDCIASPALDRIPLEQALDRLLHPHGLDWRRLDDGTIDVMVVATPASSLKLSELEIAGDPLPEVPLPDHPLATPLVEHATASTTLDQRWLDTAPLLGFNQIGWYAPNVYGSGQSLAIRGTERGSDYFPALSVTFDGIDLGTRLLDDELVSLDDVTELTLARGPRTFESGEAAQAGAVALKTAVPAAESTTSVALGGGEAGARNGSVSWSGPFGATDFGATILLDRHELPSFVRQAAVPAANIDRRDNNFGRVKLRYAPESGFSAQLAALALSGDSSDRQVAVPPRPPATFDLFDRDSYAAYPLVAQTRARGAAGFVRYDEPDRWSLDAHASVTTIARDVDEFPDETRWTDHERRRHLGLTASDHPAQDWTLLAGIEHNFAATAYYSPISSRQVILNYFSAVTDSASLWAEHRWGSTWNTGLGVRWLRENTSVSTSGNYDYAYRVPVPLAVIEWQPWKQQVFALSYGTGYRSGGPDSPGVNYPPERSRNFEFSWHATWLDERMHTAFTAFAGTIDNRYTYQFSGLVPVLANVRDRGVELELDADLSDRWRVRAGLGALSSRYSSLDFNSGDPTSEAPPQTATFGVRYGLATGWYGAADAYHAASAQYYNLAGRLPAYDVASVRAGYRTTHWDTALIVTNAFDAEYIQRIQYSAGNQVGYRLGDPRRIELRVKRTW